MNTLILINISTHSWGYLLIFIGVCTLYFISSNRFYRRGTAGFQEFKCNFLLALLITLAEWILRKAGWVFVILGIFLSIDYPKI